MPFVSDQNNALIAVFPSAGSIVFMDRFDVQHIMETPYSSQSQQKEILSTDIDIDVERYSEKWHVLLKGPDRLYAIDIGAEIDNVDLVKASDWEYLPSFIKGAQRVNIQSND